LQKHKLDAVYYYMRSLSATNPFLSAREGLNQLFDEARKKVSNFFQILALFISNFYT
jgi:ferritin-like protein